MLAVVVLLLLLVAGSAILRAERLAQQVAATGQSLMQSQRLAKSISQALVGSASAFVEVKDSADDLSRRVAGLTNGDDSLRLERVGNQYDEEMNKINPLVERADTSAKAVLAQRQILTQVGAALRDINQQSSTLLEMTETVASLKMQQNATLPEISAAGQLVMLTQRIGKSTNEFFTVEGVNPDAVFLLGKDLNTFQETTRGLLDGKREQRFPGSKDPQTREQLEAILKTYEQMRTQASAILGNLQGLVAAREAQASILTDSEPLRKSLGDLQDKLSRAPAWAPAPSCCCSCCRWPPWLCAGAIGFVQVREGREPPPTPKRERLAKPSSASGAGSRPRQQRQPGRHSSADERTADGGRRRPDAGSHRDRGHHRRHRRLGELHGGRTAPAGGQRAEHGHPRGADDVAGGKHLDRAAGRLDRTAARDSRNRPVGADHGRANQRRVLAGARVGHGGAPVAAGRHRRACRPCRTPSAA
jgi:twitching motility protein PilJ